MRANTRLNEVRKVLYRLKHSSGQPVTFYKYKEQYDNVETGQEFVDFDIYYLPQVIILESNDLRKFNYDLPFIATNRNFTYGVYFDVSTRWLILDHKNLPAGFEPTQDDHVTLFGNRYEIKTVQKFVEYHCTILVCTMLSNNVPFVKHLADFFEDTDFEAEEYARAALDALCRDIIKDVFDYNVPDNFLLATFCGNSLDDAIKCIWHPSGTGTELVTYNMAEDDFIEIGKNGGLLFNGVDAYIDTGFSLDEIAFDDAHVSIFGSNLQNDGHLVGARDLVSGCSIDFDMGSFIGDCGDLGEEVSKVDSSEIGHICISSESDDSLKLYINGVLKDTNINVRSQAFPSLDLFLGAINVSSVASNFNNYRVLTLTAGPSLSPAKALALYNAVYNFNLMLGRAL
jgi:hypothetical protein